jgi:hypothetical protein
VIIHSLERGHRFTLLLPDPQLVIHDPVVLHDQPVAEQGGPAKLAQERRGELLERVGQNDHLRLRSELVQKFLPALDRMERADDLLDVGQLQTVPVQDRQASAHQLVVIRFVTRGAAQFRNAGLFGDGDPDLGSQYSLHVQRDDRLFHRAEIEAGNPNPVEPAVTGIVSAKWDVGSSHGCFAHSRGP